MTGIGVGHGDGATSGHLEHHRRRTADDDAADSSPRRRPDSGTRTDRAGGSGRRSCRCRCGRVTRLRRRACRTPAGTDRSARPRWSASSASTAATSVPSLVPRRSAGTSASAPDRSGSRWSAVRFGYHCASSLPRFVENQVVGAGEQEYGLLLLRRCVQEQPEQRGFVGDPLGERRVQRRASGGRRREVDELLGERPIERIDQLGSRIVPQWFHWARVPCLSVWLRSSST